MYGGSMCTAAEYDLLSRSAVARSIARRAISAILCNVSHLNYKQHVRGYLRSCGVSSRNIGWIKAFACLLSRARYSVHALITFSFESGSQPSWLSVLEKSQLAVRFR
jgi:hypothetical protein